MGYDSHKGEYTLEFDHNFFVDLKAYAVGTCPGDTIRIAIPSELIRVVDQKITTYEDLYETEDQDMSPKFTKKHYDTIAEVLKNSVSTVSKSETFNEGEKQMILFGVSAVTSALMQQFKDDNVRFDKQLFLNALKEDKKDE